MTTEAPARSGYGTSFGVGGVLACLLGRTEVAKALQKSNAQRIVRSMHRSLLKHELRAGAVEESMGSAKGRTLAQLPFGRVTLGVFLALAVLDERRFESVAPALAQVEQEPTTRPMAVGLRGLALEELGDAASADACIRALAEQESRYWLGLLLQSQEVVGVSAGIRAFAEGRIDVFDNAARRYLTLIRHGTEQGFPHATGSTLEAFRLSLVGGYAASFDAMWVCQYWQSSPDERKGWLLRAPIERKRLEEETGGRALEALDEFTELVRLLAIEDPFERWDELARLISADWPEGLSAVDAIREMRE
jgi:hypothetical protein